MNKGIQVNGEKNDLATVGDRQDSLVEVAESPRAAQDYSCCEHENRLEGHGAFCCIHGESEDEPLANRILRSCGEPPVPPAKINSMTNNVLTELEIKAILHAFFSANSSSLDAFLAYQQLLEAWAGGAVPDINEVEKQRKQVMAYLAEPYHDELEGK